MRVSREKAAENRERIVETAIRTAAHVPGSQDVINAFANSDAGDMTSGIQYNGPADAEYVGDREAAAMLDAWRQAGGAMTRDPAFGLRFTRVCMCGQDTSDENTLSVPSASRRSMHTSTIRSCATSVPVASKSKTHNGLSSFIIAGAPVWREWRKTRPERRPARTRLRG